MGKTRPWSRVGPGVLLGGPPPFYLHSRTLLQNTQNPANPPQCGKPAKGVGPVAWSQRRFLKILGGGVEPLGDELVEDQETVLSLSKNFPALHSALHGSSQVPRDRGAASEPAASELLKSSQACKQLSSQKVPSPALHRCSTEADQSLAAAPATPSLSTCQNFIFSNLFVRIHNMGIKTGQISEYVFRRSKNILIRLKNF
jgi:hypothetical protein